MKKKPNNHEYIKKLLFRIEELEDRIGILIDFIPEGWEVPLGWTAIVSQARKLIEKKEEEDE